MEIPWKGSAIECNVAVEWHQNCIYMANESFMERKHGNGSESLDLTDPNSVSGHL